MKVIKLGGSLLHSSALSHCLHAVIRRFRQQRIVIVPGGGAFAEQVRLAQQQWQFDDRAAHCMAILAMQQMALMFQSLQPDWKIISSVGEIADKRSSLSVIIWSPQIVELDRAGVPASWEVTSDSLAAWLAAQLKASELILVKAANLSLSASIAELQAHGVVDRAFHHFTEQVGFTIRIINQQQL